MRAPPGVVSHDQEVSIRQPRDEDITLPRTMLVLSLLACERDQHYQTALAPHHVLRETDLAHLLRRRLRQLGRTRNPRLRHEQRIVAPPRPLRLGHLNGKRRRFPGVPELECPGGLLLFGAEFGAKRVAA